MSELEPLTIQAVDWLHIGWAVALLVLAAVILVLEFFVVSMGLLSVVSIACVAGAIYFAFLAGDIVGWAFTVVTPVLAVLIVRWGVKHIRTSRALVPQAEVTGEAGYHHVADRIGVAPGAVGSMVTPARPSGRARFEGGECDVQVQGRPLETNARVVVKRIDGPIIFVVPMDDDSKPDETGDTEPART